MGRRRADQDRIRRLEAELGIGVEPPQERQARLRYEWLRDQSGGLVIDSERARWPLPVTSFSASASSGPYPVMPVYWRVSG